LELAALHRPAGLPIKSIKPVGTVRFYAVIAIKFPVLEKDRLYAQDS
jgi:hypothetical protein